jgi:hypothetical protein
MASVNSANCLVRPEMDRSGSKQMLVIWNCGCYDEYRLWARKSTTDAVGFQDLQ